MRLLALSFILFLGMAAHLSASAVFSTSCYLRITTTYIPDTASETGTQSCSIGVDSLSGGVSLQASTLEQGFLPSYADLWTSYSLYSEASVDGPWNFKVMIKSYETLLTSGSVRPGFVSIGTFGAGGGAPGFSEAALSDGTHTYIQVQGSPHFNGLLPFTLGTPFSMLTYINAAASQQDLEYFRADGGAEIEISFLESDGRTPVNILQTSAPGIPIPIGSVPEVSSFGMTGLAAVLLSIGAALRNRSR
jgi:hypothetical protein